jgi:tight adherence protein C
LAIVIIIVVAFIAIAAVLVVIGLRNPQAQTDKLIMERLETFSQSTEQLDLEQLELSQPFAERVILPIARKLGEVAIRFTPQNWLNSVSRKLELAGSSSKLDPSTFLTFQFGAAIGFGVIAIVASIFLLKETSLGMKFLLCLVAVVFGFMFPSIDLSSKIKKRQKSIRLSMPDALDLLTICVEAGLGFEAAMVKVAEKWESPLSQAFARVIQEVQVGKTRRDALRDMANNIDISEMTSFVATIIQSEVLGVSMAKVLRIQSDQMRVRRRQLAEEEAHKAPIKMLIPMVLLTFPSLLIILMTPAVISILQSGLFGG